LRATADGAGDLPARESCGNTIGLVHIKRERETYESFR
jgi:hypothetical protein